jgi:hypothetical protein
MGTLNNQGSSSVTETDDCFATPMKAASPGGFGKTRKWKAALDVKTKRTYYYNRVTRATQWEKPEGFDEAQKKTKRKRYTEKSSVKGSDETTKLVGDIVRDVENPTTLFECLQQKDWSGPTRCTREESQLRSGDDGRKTANRRDDYDQLPAVENRLEERDDAYCLNNGTLRSTGINASHQLLFQTIGEWYTAPVKKKDEGIEEEWTLNNASNSSTASISKIPPRSSYNPSLKHVRTYSESLQEETSMDGKLTLIATVRVNSCQSEGESTKRLDRLNEEGDVIPPQQLLNRPSGFSVGTNSSTSFKSKLANCKLDPRIILEKINKSNTTCKSCDFNTSKSDTKVDSYDSILTYSQDNETLSWSSPFGATKANASFKSKLMNYKLTRIISDKYNKAQDADDCAITKCKSHCVYRGSPQSPRRILNSLSFPQDKAQESHIILENPSMLTFDDFIGDDMENKSLEYLSIMTVPYHSKGKNEGTRNVKEYRTNGKKSEPYNIRGCSNLAHKQMGLDDGNQHSNMTTAGSVGTYHLEEANSMMSTVYENMMGCNSAHNVVGVNRENDHPNAPIIGSCVGSLEKRGRGVTSDERTDNECFAILQQSCSGISQEIPEDWEQLSLGAHVADTHTTLLFIFLHQREWISALNRVIDHPIEASAWIQRKTNGYVLWRLLPLHACIILGAPSYLVMEILNAYPPAAHERCMGGSLPVHLAVSRLESHPEGERIVNHLVRAFPDCVDIADARGRTAIGIMTKCGRAVDWHLPREPEEDFLLGHSSNYSVESGYQTFKKSDLSEEERLQVSSQTTIENHLDSLKSGYIRLLFKD